MTTVVVVADPPVQEAVSLELPGAPLSDADITALYGAMLADVCATVQHASGDLLVNYPAESPDGIDAETTLRDHLAGELPDPESARYEVQVGADDAERIGNALTHLLETEEEATAAVLDPTAPLFRRKHFGKASMELRSNEVVLGPTPGGGIYFAGFVESIDFDDALAPPAIGTLSERAVDAGLDVSQLSMLPRLVDADGLRTGLALIRARQRAGFPVPERTVELFEEWDLTLENAGFARGSDNS